MKKVSRTSIAKPEQGQNNEDYARASEKLLAVSDGAGGGGIYADLWSKYLLEHLPESPVTAFAELDQWLDGIWEEFYNACEAKAQAAGGMVLNKFYDEGSFATLAAVWLTEGRAQWMSYGDSVVFHYNKKTDVLEHSFTKLADFNNPPYLINSKDPLKEEGFRSGEFLTDDNSVLFCATDALSHYILMMYELSHKEEYQDELTVAQNAGSRNSTYISTASLLCFDYFQHVITKLIHCGNRPRCFRLFVEALLRKRLIALDDYSYALLNFNKR